jgi:predicted O-methyltransferase YrrM
VARSRDRLLATARATYHRRRGVRELAAVAKRLRGGTRDLPDLAHLAFYEEGPMQGPLQRDEALFLHALVRVLRPRTVVELGFFRGHSAFNFLCALDPDARLYSFDVDPDCAQTARERFGHDPRLIFRVRSQDALTTDDLDGRPADLVFIDAAHDLALNETTFERLVELLAPEAIVAIHDTGTVPRELLGIPDGHWLLDVPRVWVDDEFEHQPGERAFVNRLLERHPEFAQVHLHSRRTIRAGLTVLQRSAPLRRPPDTDE